MNVGLREAGEEPGNCWDLEVWWFYRRLFGTGRELIVLRGHCDSLLWEWAWKGTVECKLTPKHKKRRLMCRCYRYLFQAGTQVVVPLCLSVHSRPVQVRTQFCPQHCWESGAFTMAYSTVSLITGAVLPLPWHRDRLDFSGERLHEISN